MIGLRTGLATGIRTSIAAGLAADPIKSGTVTTTTQTIALADNSTAGAVITGADAFAITATYTNTGAVNATTVSVAITLDANATYVSSSGTGWSISGPTAHVLTCTRATAAPGAAPVITVNLTSPTSATTLTTTAQATASNASTANSNTDSITVNLVTKDATAGIYCPSSATEWTNFIARKVPGLAGPSFLWLLQDSASPAAETIGGTVTLAASGSAGTFQTAQAGWSRVGWSATDALAGALSSTSASLPDPASTSSLVIAYAALRGAPSAEHTVFSATGTPGGGSSTRVNVSTASKPVIRDNANAATATNAVNTSVHPWVARYNFTGSTTTFFGDVEKISPTFGAGVGKGVAIGATGLTTANIWMGYLVEFTGVAAELSDANVKSLLQALGWTIAWT